MSDLVINIHHRGSRHEVYIGRPSPWGNPWLHRANPTEPHHVASRAEAVETYRLWLRQRVIDGEPGLVEALADLYGKTLGCFCHPLQCHGDVLVKASAWAIEHLADQRASV